MMSNREFVAQWALLVVLTLLLLEVRVVATATISTEEDPGKSPSPIIDNISDTVRLNDGKSMPRVGLGVALTYDKTYDAIQSALSAGYRLVDTAAEETYGNEDQVGQAIRDYSETDDHVFVTTKLWDSDHGFYETLEAFDESYDTLKVGAVDLYLMHSPFGGKLLETWDALVYIQQKGYIESVGVSNFGIQHLQVIQESGRPLPVVNQIEMHPLNYKQRTPLIEWCREHNVYIQAYGSLMHGYEEWLMADYPLKDMAARLKKTTAQVLLRWALQHNFLIIPKSSSKHRIVENSLLYDFELSQADMATLDHWGDEVKSQERNIYKKDWNWNPIDEAPVSKRSRTSDYWPKYEGVDEIYLTDDDEEDAEDEEL